MRDGRDLEVLPTNDSKYLNMGELESLMAFIKRKNMQTLTKAFQLKAHKESLDTITNLLVELGMGYRVARMQREESQINIERVYVMTCRAHKLHRARMELINIFDGITQIEELLPKLKRRIMSKLTDSSVRGSFRASIDQ